MPLLLSFLSFYFSFGNGHHHLAESCEMLNRQRGQETRVLELQQDAVIVKEWTTYMILQRLHATLEDAGLVSYTYIHVIYIRRIIQYDMIKAGRKGDINFIFNKNV